MFLYDFLVPILPFVVENRLGLDTSYTQLGGECLDLHFIESLIASPLSRRASTQPTLPLHVHDVFHRGSFSVGMLFAGLQEPVVLLSVPVGWLRDRVGTRFPATVGFCTLLPLL
ncbi:hypothetical protein NUU61_001272 [Penicillium alfredii]|uniref:Major facilitator superfamily (MFS) profile domain-containing protein n=1 Tax=Penicillium alfredii TaxID=1506179 RepID=A0A9W9KRV0_9EURO|nr:uncharacterized protein NUU61_001272 [Penicillium alfredii]KAJ5115513.1 hypothetical protein NUU61_001272 [Penicillium alfredii]